MKLWALMKLSGMISLAVGLVFSSALISLLFYAEVSGKEIGLLSRKSATSLNIESIRLSDSTKFAEITEGDHVRIEPDDNIIPEPTILALPAIKRAASVNAPAINQYPELPAGCELTSLTMLLQHYGIDKDKMELLVEMKVDSTPMVRDQEGNIQYWGHPNVGFVGDATRTNGQAGFAIYHTALFDLLVQYVPTAIDLTGHSFAQLEKQIAQGIPAVVWTTIDYKMPVEWVEWDTPIGPFRTTLTEHAVLLVGYDDDDVYINDPQNGKDNIKLNKANFIEIWNAMGMQALSYHMD